MKLRRRNLRELALLRLREARVLLDNRCWEGAYYLAGYAVECALKACIAKSTERYEFPDKARVNASYTHDLDKLLYVAGLDKALKEATGRQLASNWKVVQQWSEDTRYERRAEADARAFVQAVGEREDGVLRWLEIRW